MRTSATVVLFLLLFSVGSFAQFDTLSPRYFIAAILIAPTVANASPLEVRLISETEIQIGRVMTFPAERFVFSNLTAGRYYIVFNGVGLKPIRHLVEVPGMDSGNTTPIVLERVEESRQPQHLSFVGNAGAVDVSRLTLPAKLSKYLETAERNLHAGRISDSKGRLESVVREAPDSYDARRLLGAAYQQDRRFKEAEAEYQFARTLRPREPEVLVRMSGLYLEMLEDASTPDVTGTLLRDARAALIEAIRIAPDAAFAHYLLGVTYHKLGMYQDSERSFLRALDLEGRLQDARLGLANVYIRLQNWSAAFAELNLYLKENPKAAGREAIVQKRAEIERRTTGDR